jgi:cystathionine beta-synthase
LSLQGLLCGGSCGAAVIGAIEAAKDLKEGQTCVVILPDSVRNYMTKSLCDDWMVDHGYVDNKIILPKNFKGSWWADKKVKDLKLNSPLTITSDVTCKDAIHLLKKGE